MKKFLVLYAISFSLIWIGYGLYAVFTGQPSAGLILGIGAAFSIVIFATTWFSSWLMEHYKKIDIMAKEIIEDAQKRIQS